MKVSGVKKQSVNSAVRSNAYLGTIATNLSILLITLVQGALLARMLRPEGRGDFLSVIYFPGLFAGIGLLGLNAAISRAAGLCDRPEKFTFLAIVASFITSSITMLVCWASIPYLLPTSSHHLLPLIHLFLLFIPINHVGLNLQAIDQGAGRFHRFNFVRLILNPIFLIGLVVCWYFYEDKLYGSVIALLVANLVSIVVRLMMRGRFEIWIPSIVELVALLGSTGKYFAANIISVLHQQVDKAVLIWLLDAVSIGQYSVANSVASVIGVFNVAISTVAFSESLNNQGHGEIHSFARVVRYAFLLSLLLWAGFSLFIPYIYPLVYGVDFQAGVSLVLILIPAYLLGSLGQILDQHLRGKGRPMEGAIAGVLATIIIVILAWTLVPFCAVKGLAIAYFVGMAALYSYLFFGVVRFHGSASLTLFFLKYEDLLGLRDIALRKFRKAK